MWTERDIREQTDEQTFYRGKLLESTNGVLEFSSFETEGVYGDKELNLRATIHGTQAVFPGAVAKFYILQQPPPAAKPWTPKVCSACTAARDRTDNSRIKPAPLKIAGAGFLYLSPRPFEQRW